MSDWQTDEEAKGLAESWFNKTCAQNLVDGLAQDVVAYHAAKCTKCLSHAEIAKERDEAVRILKALFNNEHYTLEDAAYNIREREGMGCEGNSVMEWGAAVEAGEKFLKEISIKETEKSLEARHDA